MIKKLMNYLSIRKNYISMIAIIGIFGTLSLFFPIVLGIGVNESVTKPIANFLFYFILSMTILITIIYVYDFKNKENLKYQRENMFFAVNLANWAGMIITSFGVLMLASKDFGGYYSILFYLFIAILCYFISITIIFYVVNYKKSKSNPL